MFFSSNIRLSCAIRSRYVRAYTNDMQEEWCGFRRMPNGLFLPSTQFRRFIILFIHRSFDFIFHAQCVWTSDVKRNTKNCFRSDLSLNIFQRLEHKPINVLFSMYSTHSSVDIACWDREVERERESTKKSQSKRHQPLKKIVSTVFWRWKLIRKVSVDLFWCPKYLPRIAISTYRLHRCKYTSHLIYEHIISVMWIFSIYILNEMRIDVAGGKNGNIHQTPSKTYQFLSEMTFCYLSPARDLAKKKRQTGRMACVAFVLSCQHVAEFYSIFSSGFSAVK